MRIQTPATKKARIEIIPMIDTIFFLLVFFMFSSLSMIKMKGVGVDLPRPAGKNGGGGRGRSARMVVTVTPRGDYYLNKKRTTLEALTPSLQQGIEADPRTVIVVNVAKAQTTQTLINVMDAIGKVTPPGGHALPVLIATEPVDLNGNALPASPTVTSGVAPAAGAAR